MQLARVKASTRTTHAFGMLKTATGIGPEAWARISICISIKQKGIPNPDEYNKGGTDFSPSNLFAGDEKIYLALITNRLKQDGLDPETYMNEMIRAHLNRGAISLKQRVSQIIDAYSMMDEMGVETQEVDIPTPEVDIPTPEVDIPTAGVTSDR